MKNLVSLAVMEENADGERPDNVDKDASDEVKDSTIDPEMEQCNDNVESGMDVEEAVDEQSEMDVANVEEAEKREEATSSSLEEEHDPVAAENQPALEAADDAMATENSSNDLAVDESIASEEVMTPAAGEVTEAPAMVADTVTPSITPRAYELPPAYFSEGMCCCFLVRCVTMHKHKHFMQFSNICNYLYTICNGLINDSWRKLLVILNRRIYLTMKELQIK